MAAKTSWEGTWTQKWVEQVTGRRFRNFAVPRTSLLQRLRSVSATHGRGPAAGTGARSAATPDDSSTVSAYERRPPAAAERRPNAEDNTASSFDHLQFTPARAAHFKPLGTASYFVTGEELYPYNYPQYMKPEDDSNSSSVQSSVSSRDKDSDQSSSRCKGSCVARGIVGIVCFLGIAGVIAAALYLVLSRPDSDVSQPTLSGLYAARLSATVTSEIYQEQMRNVSSAEFSEFQSRFCQEMNTIYSNVGSLTKYSGCSIDQLKNGSVITEYSLFFTRNTAPSMTVIVTSLVVEGAVNVSSGTLTLAGGLALKISAILVNAVAEVSAAEFRPNVPGSVTPSRSTLTTTVSVNPTSETITSTDSRNSSATDSITNISNSSGTTTTTTVNSTISTSNAYVTLTNAINTPTDSTSITVTALHSGSTDTGNANVSANTTRSNTASSLNSNSTAAPTPLDSTAAMGVSFDANTTSSVPTPLSTPPAVMLNTAKTTDSSTLVAIATLTTFNESVATVSTLSDAATVNTSPTDAEKATASDSSTTSVFRTSS